MSIPPNIISDGTAFPASSSGAIYTGQTGVGFSGITFEKSGEPSTRHWIGQQLYGNTGLPNDRRFRAYESLDKGVTWAEVDAGNGPRYPANAPGTSGATTMDCATAQDFTGKKIYLIYWNVGYFLSIIPFDQVTKKFGAPVVSTIILTPPLTDSGWLYRNACFRPSDSSIWLGYTVGLASGGSTFQLVKFAGGTLAASTFNLSVPFTNCTIWGLQTNPVDNTLVGVTYDSNTQTNLASFVVHTDDSISAVNVIESAAVWAQLYDGPIVDTNGEAKICVRKAGDFTQMQVIRWQSADVPVVYNIDVLAVPADADPFRRLATAPGGTTYVCYRRVTAGVRNFVYRASAAVGQAWDAEAFLGQNIASIADPRILPNYFSQTPGLGISMGFQNFSEGGQGYLEVDFAAPPPPPGPAAHVSDLQLQVIPFPLPPIGNFAHLIQCGPDGRLYASVKGVLRECRLK